MFDERIYSRPVACVAIFLMMMGLCGMSYYSSLEKEPQSTSATPTNGQSDTMEDDEFPTSEAPEYIQMGDEEATNDAPDVDHHAEESTEGNRDHALDGPLLAPALRDVQAVPENPSSSDNNNDSSSPDTVMIRGRRFARRKVGIACSVFCGAWGGSIMAPEKLAGATTSGEGYLISFGIGAALVTTALWIFRFGYHWTRLGSASEAYQALPSFHIKVMWLPGCTAGALWSIGNFFSLISVKYLGEGVGYSVTQSAMLGEDDI